MKFTEQRLFGHFTGLHAALRKLPAAAPGPAAQQYRSIATHQNDADVGAEAFIVDDVTHAV